ncbi:protein kinase [Trypanosoma rangeli]|uniref:Protein kinase n=1 Tax=Trypanosoma rangeli TaxID=5698 RepID=A0A3R7L700_TRYRA|nr:protein kinase [Trypanosoma rangeli]RNF08866.1 protein kinase [Trypanosoma rangeli]|eukprot:RNF08866.1 protein kinase [Trypanosoma rangeli]
MKGRTRKEKRVQPRQRIAVHVAGSYSDVVDSSDRLDRQWNGFLNQDSTYFPNRAPSSTGNSRSADNSNQILSVIPHPPVRCDTKVASSATTWHLDPTCLPDNTLEAEKRSIQLLKLPSFFSVGNTDETSACSHKDEYKTLNSSNALMGHEAPVLTALGSNEPPMLNASLSAEALPRRQPRQNSEPHEIEEDSAADEKGLGKQHHRVNHTIPETNAITAGQLDTSCAFSDGNGNTVNVANTSRVGDPAQSPISKPQELCCDWASCDSIGANSLPLENKESNASSASPCAVRPDASKNMNFEMHHTHEGHREEGNEAKSGDSRWCRTRGLPLVSVLVPYFLVLLCLSLFCSLTPYYVTMFNVRDSVMEIHDYIRLELQSQLDSALNIAGVLANVFVALYIRNERHPNPNDEWVPMGVQMSQRLCAALHNMDHHRLLTHAYIASIQRDEIALCTRGFHPYYLSTTNRNSTDRAIVSLLAVDPVTMTLLDPPLVLKELHTPFQLKDLVNNLTPTGSLLKAWKADVDAGREPRMQQWMVEHFLNSGYAYTHPFIEKNGSVAFVKVSIDLRKVIDQVLVDKSGSLHSTRVMLLENGEDFEKLTLVASNSHGKWDSGNKRGELGLSPVSNPMEGDEYGEHIFFGTSFGEGKTGGLPASRKRWKLEDPLMRRAFQYVKMKEVLATVRKGKAFHTRFLYRGALSTFSVSLMQSEHNATMLLFVVAPHLYSEGLQTPHLLSFVGTFLTTLSSTLLVYAVLTIFVSRPLHNIAAELRLTAKVEDTSLSDSSTNAGNKSDRFALLEIYVLESVAASLRDQMCHLRSFLPQGLSSLRPISEERGSRYMDTGVKNETGGRSLMNKGNNKAFMPESCLKCVKESGIGVSGIYGPQEQLNVFEDIMCSVVSVHILDIKTIVEYASEIANIVVEAARKFGGGIDVFLPETFNLNFPRRGESHSDKLDAILCALEIHHKLPDVVRCCCVILVDSGIFHFGVCGGPEKKEPVLWGRTISTDLIHVQRCYGVSLAILQSTVPFIRSRVNVLPFASVRVHAPDMSPKVTFHIVIEDIVNESSWQCVEETYLKGFRYLTVKALTEARMCFESLLASPYVTPQLLCLLRCQLAQVQQCEVKSGTTIAPERCHLGSDRVDTTTSKWSPLSILHSESTMTGAHHHIHTSRESRRRPTYSDTSSVLSDAQLASAGITITSEFWDKKNVRWKRAAEGFPECGRFPVFLGISDTGTLAALKFVPISSLQEYGFADLETLERAWAHAQTLYHENIVQFLGYGRSKEYVCSIVEYVPGGSLRDTLRRYGRPLPLMAIKRFLVSALRGLEYLHNRGLVHGSLRPEGVLVAVEGLYKLGGTSTACTAEEAASTTAESLRLQSCSNRWAYSSPEVFTSGQRSAAADIYAVGVILLELITNQMPWRWMDLTAASQRKESPAAEDETTWQQNAKKTVTDLTAILSDYDSMKEAQMQGGISLVEIPREGDAILQEVLRSCLVTDPKGRKTASELLQLLHNMQ